MCLAIPGRIIELSGDDSRLAVVDVSGVRRRINVDLLKDDALAVGDWVLIHVGFAMSRISDAAASEQLRLIAMLGEDVKAMEELEGYAFDDTGEEAS
jgi:hydrogenase expression/formation protein HypC